MKKFFQGVKRCLKSGYAAVSNWGRSCVEGLQCMCSGQVPEPELPNFDACLTPDELQKEAADYVSRCERWQKREHKRLDYQLYGRPGWIERHRVLAVLSATVVTILLLAIFFNCMDSDPSYFDVAKYFELMKSSAGVLFLAAPIAFVIWAIRDANAREQLTNQRADTNLKNFQRVMDLASGALLKNHQQPTGDSPDSPPNLPSEQTGEESLQIASVYTLAGFLVGKYGDSFVQPAFHLLLELWRSISSTNVWHLQSGVDERNNTIANGYPEALRHATASRQYLFHLKPLEKAVHSALFSGAGRVFTDQRVQMRRLQIYGVRGMEREFRLVRANLCETFWNASFLCKSNFSGANLSHTNFFSCNCPESSFVAATFQYASLNGFSAHKACFVGADLSQSNAWGGSFDGADFRGAILNDCYLEGASFLGADLRGVSINDATKLKRVKIDNKTRFGDLGSLPNSDSAVIERQRWLARGAIDSGA